MRLNFKTFFSLLAFCLIGFQANADRLKDLVSIAGLRTNQLLGYGIVVGLAGTGDSTTNATLQSIKSMISQFGVVAATERN